MKLKRELKKKTEGKSKLILLCTFPAILIGAIAGVIFTHFNTNNKPIVENDEKEYQYEYEYDENWKEVLKYTEEQKEKYKNIKCECG